MTADSSPRSPRARSATPRNSLHPASTKNKMSGTRTGANGSASPARPATQTVMTSFALVRPVKEIVPATRARDAVPCSPRSAASAMTTPITERKPKRPKSAAPSRRARRSVVASPTRRATIAVPSLMALPRVVSAAADVSAGAPASLSGELIRPLSMIGLGVHMLSQVVALSSAWAIAAFLLAWPHLSGQWRRRLALASSAGAVLSLILAMSTEGFRESPTVAVFLMGRPYVLENTAASAGLPYYVITGSLLFLGFAGMALGDDAADRLRRHPLAIVVALSLLVTAVRFLLEKAAAPASWTHIVGITWIAPVVGAYLALCYRAEKRSFPALLGALVLYAFLARGAVAALMVVATRFRLGSHYDVSPLTLVVNPLTGGTLSFVAGSAEQVLQLAALPELIAWPIYTVLAGLIGVGLAHVLVLAWGRSGSGSAAVTRSAPDPVPQD